jgi:anti-sigma-K factor RskA
MRWRVLLILSLLANVLLIAGLVFSARHASPPATAALDEANSPIVKTNVVLRHQYLSWSHVESPD